MAVKKASGASVSKLAVIYARYSSHSQREVSIDQQVSACRRFAEANDMTVLQVYADHAMTGTNDNRPEFRQMIHDSASHSFAYVIVYALDRFSRDRYDSAVHKHTLKENGVRVLSAMENISDDPTGVLMESVLEGFAEYYSKELSQKVRRGMNDNASRCMVLGNTPLGYRRGEDGRYAVVEEEAQLVREIFQRFSAREPLADISRDLNARGLTTKRGSPWGRSSYHTMLRDERYIGVYNHMGHRVEGGVPAIVDKAVFDRVQEVCVTKPRPVNTPQRRRRESGTYLLTGKLYCGECKGAMVGIAGTSKTGALHFYYVCKNHRDHKNDCHKSSVTRDKIEERIAAYLQQMICENSFVDWLADQVARMSREESETGEIGILRDRLQAVKKKKDNTLQAITMGVVTPSVKDLLLQLEADEETLSAKLSIAEQRESIALGPEHVYAFIEYLRDGDIHDKQYQERLFDALLVRAYVYDNKLTLVCTPTGDAAVDIPFDIDTIDPPTIDPSPPTDKSSYKLTLSPPFSPYTNSTVYFVNGLFVMVGQIAGRL